MLEVEKMVSPLGEMARAKQILGEDDHHQSFHMGNDAQLEYFCEALRA